MGLFGVPVALVFVGASGVRGGPSVSGRSNECGDGGTPIDSGTTAGVGEEVCTELGATPKGYPGAVGVETLASEVVGLETAGCIPSTAPGAVGEDV